MTEAAKIVIAFQGYWISGGGKAGAGVDAVTERDDRGCPVMPMSQVKGTLRETAARLWPDEVAALFGDENGGSSPLAFVGYARLPEAVRAWFAHPGNAAARRQLYRHVAATRINDQGVADDKTLRRMEVAVPLTLEGRVEWSGSPGHPLHADWVARLDAICAATLAFGKSKADGFGRAITSCHAEVAP